MEMIIGGAFQGKNHLAVKTYPEITWVKGGEADWEEISTAEGILGFQDYICRQLKAGREVSDLASRLIQANPDVVIVSDEVGYGLVPIDAFERKFREAVGRVCTELAAYSTKVTRVVCGIGTVIKDA